jgi:hypothetical protein
MSGGQVALVILMGACAFAAGALIGGAFAIERDMVPLCGACGKARAIGRGPLPYPPAPGVN